MFWLHFFHEVMSSSSNIKHTATATAPAPFDKERFGSEMRLRVIGSAGFGCFREARRPRAAAPGVGSPSPGVPSLCFTHELYFQEIRKTIEEYKGK